MTTATLHTASLVDRSQHPVALMELVDSPMNPTLIGAHIAHLHCELHSELEPPAHVVKEVVETVECPICGSTVTNGEFSRHLNNYVSKIVSNAHVKTAVLLTVLVYLSRAKARIVHTHRHLAHKPIFLGTLIIAHKVTYHS